MDRVKKIRRDANVDRLNASLERSRRKELERMGMPVQGLVQSHLTGEQPPPMMTRGDLAALHILAEAAASAQQIPTKPAPQAPKKLRTSTATQGNRKSISRGPYGNSQQATKDATDQHGHSHRGDSCAGCNMTDEQMRTLLGCNLPNPLHVTVPARINKEIARMGYGSAQKTRAVATYTHKALRKVNALNSAAIDRANAYIAHPEHFETPEYPPFPPILPTNPERCRLAIKTWLLLKRFLGQGTEDAEAALALMNLNREGIKAILGEPKRGSAELRFAVLGKLY